MAFKPVITPATKDSSSGSSTSSPSTSTPGTKSAPSGFVAPKARPYPPRSSSGGSRFSRGDNNNKDDVRLNERIRVPQVRLIDDQGEQVGIVATQEALRMAQEKGLDLMEVAATANPPVCKICDYGKFKYEKKKKEAQARKNQVIVKVKEVQLRPNTDSHDVEYKIRNAEEFLKEGDKVKFSIFFRGREITHSEAGYKLCEMVADRLKEFGVVDSRAKMDGRKMIMILAPVGSKKK